MHRRTLFLLALILISAVAISAAGKTYGTPLTLKETTKISAIYAEPEHFNGTRVQRAGANRGRLRNARLLDRDRQRRRVPVTPLQGR